MDLDAWHERAAIMEFDGGLTRFQAEALAAKAQGKERFEFINAERKRNSERGGNTRPPMAQRAGADNVSRVQRGAAQENRSMPERDGNRNGRGVELLALRTQRGGVL